MPSRLSSLLVRDGLVGVKRMEKAYQRQVIYGGSLDTILLEMTLVPEERLTQYLALASGLPPASRDDGNDIEPSALELIEKDIAEQFRAVPLNLAPDGEALRVLVCAPLELSELEDLADLLDRPLQPLIGPEYRWHLVYAKAYGLEPNARFLTLERQLEVEAAPSPVGRARSIIIDDHPVAPLPQNTQPFVPAPPRAPATAAPSLQPVPQLVPLTPADATMKIDSAPKAEHLARGRTNTRLGFEAPRMNTDPGTGIPPRAAEAVPTVPVAQVDDSLAIRGSRSSAPIETTGRESPLSVVPAREALATAEDRDTVFLTLLRASRARVRYAGLLTVQGGAVIGRVALAEGGIDTKAIEKVLIPLDVQSPFRTVVHTRQPHIGPLACGDKAIDAMVLRLGGTMPTSALLMPIVLRDRVVSIIVAHRSHSDLKLVDVTELLPLAAAAADALGRLIVKHKSAGYRSPTGAPSVPLDGDAVDTKKIVKDMEWRSPAPAERPSLPQIEVTITAEPPRPMTEVIDEIEGAKEGGAEDAISDAVERASDTLGELMRRFPGKLRVDRFAVAGRPLRAAQYGGMLDLVVRLGSIASDLLIDKMSSADRDARFYATVCTAELRPRNAVFALVERIFDQDFGVRAMAIEALAGYPVEDLTPALAKARRAIHASEPDTVVAAATAVVALGDVEAVSDLIGVIERGDRAADPVRKALVLLTAQDFGASERKWRKWYDGARKRHRIEWLIDGLGHKEDAVRESAINDLRRLTGEYFGYHHDLPKKEREASAERWSAWWRETGQRRFVLKDDESKRPTAVIPTTRRE